MWTWLASLITGPIINGAINAYKAKLEAGNTEDRIAADLAAKQFELDAKEARVRAEVLIAEQGNWVTRSIRPLFGLAAVILTWKILVWDLAFGQWTRGRTDMLSEQALWLLTTVVIAYMGGRTIEKVADRIAGVLKR